MPLKNGPNGTLRYYSATNGRYTKIPIDLEITSTLKKDKKKRKELKLLNRTNMLREKAYKSSDKLLKEVFDFLESKIPHYVQYVNEKIYVNSDNRTHEIDIIGKNAIIEIKSGRRSKHIKQLMIQKEICIQRKLKTILFMPSITYNAKKEYEK